MQTLKNHITHWYLDNKRDLPWRRTTNPYKIWLSEIILQQTKVEQGLSYYLKFIEQYPTITALSEAPIDDILRLWQGLGYYSRARNIHYTANVIVNKQNGVFPDNYTDICKLKGIGDYTASAISSFAFGEVQPVLDGNVFRVISRFYGIYDDIAKGASRKIFKEILFKEIDKKDPATFNQAMMEFGALQCSPKSPKCTNCPINTSCYAFEKNEVDILPVKSKTIKKRDRNFHYILLKHLDKYAFEKREKKDIWQGLFQPILHEENVDIENLISQYESLDIIRTKIFEPNKKHILSHQHIYSQMIEIETATKTNLDYYTIDEIKKIGKPILIENFLNKYIY